MKKSFIIRFIACLILAGLAFAMRFVQIDYKEYIKITLFVLAYLVIGIDILKKAIKNIFNGEIFDENFLMCVATIGAICIKEFPEAIAVMLLYQIGEQFQSMAVGKSRRAIKALMKIKPDFANVLRNGEIIRVSPEEVQIGENIIIKPGEKVPLDGVVVNGYSMLDTKTYRRISTKGYSEK